MPVIEKTASPEAMLEKENLAYLGEADAKKESTFTPKIVAFCCNWCSYAGADLAGNNRADYPADIKIIRVPCSGRVNPLFIMRAFEKGVGRGEVRIDHERVCRYDQKPRQEREIGGYQMQELINRAKELLADGTVVRVLGWKKGDLPYNPEPHIFTSAQELEKDFIYNGFCGANLSKYMIAATKLEGKTLVFLKPCDTFSFNQLIKEHQVNRDNAYIIGVGCKGKLDHRKFAAMGLGDIAEISGIELSDACDRIHVKTIYGEEKDIDYRDVMLERCFFCKTKEHQIFDEKLLDSKDTVAEGADRFEEVRKIEAMTPAERYAFFRSELSKCIRCNACRNVCPACNCRHCVFDNTKYDTAQKANADTFEENMFHIIRAFHVAGRCTDCGECSRVCPQNIPLHLFNRKFILDADDLYGEFQAGSDTTTPGPLTAYTLHDVEPAAGLERSRG